MTRGHSIAVLSSTPSVEVVLFGGSRMTDDKSVDIVSDTTVLVFSESCLLSLVYH